MTYCAYVWSPDYSYSYKHWQNWYEPKCFFYISVSLRSHQLSLLQPPHEPGNHGSQLAPVIDFFETCNQNPGKWQQWIKANEILNIHIQALVVDRPSPYLLFIFWFDKSETRTKELWLWDELACLIVDLQLNLVEMNFLEMVTTFPEKNEIHVKDLNSRPNWTETYIHCLTWIFFYTDVWKQ